MHNEIDVAYTLFMISIYSLATLINNAIIMYSGTSLYTRCLIWKCSCIFTLCVVGHFAKVSFLREVLLRI